jgi:hypothetical protein
MNMYLLAVEALEGGCTLRQVQLLTRLPAATIDALAVALEGEASGHDVYREMTFTAMSPASRSASFISRD